MPTLANYELIIWIGHWMPVLWLFIFGCCVGSLINVLAYRLPLGLSVVHPPSACPSCHTHLTWRENIPVLGWLLLRGRCRFCKSKISPQYPIIELFVGLLWGTTYALWYCIPDYGPGPFGIPWATLKPDWAKGGIAASWPILLVYLSLLSSLVAMTLTDLKSFMIPLVLPWFATIVGLIGHTGWSIYIQLSSGSLPGQRPEDPLWSIATPPLPSSGGWWWIGAAAGGTLGLGLGLLLLRFKLVGHSFADYPAWEAEQIAKQAEQAKHLKAAEQANTPALVDPNSSPAPAGDASLATQAIATPDSQPAAAIPPAAAPAQANAPEDDPTQLWITYPHARREMIKEMAFLAPCAALAWVGGWLATRLTGGLDAAAAFTPGPDGNISINLLNGPPIPPLWLSVLTGVLMGYLIGGGLVWGVRILGSLGFNKEAMGLGDVHLLAAIGACCGWIDSVLTFFTAAFVGLAWTLIGALAGGGARRTLPFGPSLAIGCLLVLWAKPFYRWALGRLMHSDGPFGLP